MAVPKKRTGHAAQGSRRANWKATNPETTICSNCGQPVLAHTVCTACGYYKGEPVSLKDKKAKEEEVKEVKKAPKKKTAAKKTTKKAAAKTEEAPKAEETKSEEKAEEVKEEAKEDKSVEE